MSLHEACRFGNMDICRELLKSGANINAKDKLGDTPLHIAAKAGNIDKGNIPFCQFLLDSGAQINSKNSQGLTPLHSAIQTGQIPTAQFLIEKGADIKAKTDGGWTVLHLAAETGNLAACKLLIQLGADPNWRDGKKKTPMDHSKSHPEVFQHLKTLTKKTSLLSILRN
ncbi:ankyrin repeat protein [Gorgonomyces haynaldii]|nr:ankyrin repeat protein [Gorgonomyces haynaldii]